MSFIVTQPIIKYKGKAAEKAADLFSDELKIRGLNPSVNQFRDGGCVIELCIQNDSESEEFEIIQNKNRINITAHRLRGLIYGYSVFLRKLETADGKVILKKDISGKFSPSMKLRCHGIGYTDMSNAYEAWDESQFRRYILDLMYFGMNTVESSFTPDEKPTRLMKYTYSKALEIISGICAELDIDFMPFHALKKELTDEQTLRQLEVLFSRAKKIDYLFLPGGDPGDLQADEFVKRCKAIKKGLSARFPDLKLLASAQAPHEYPDWGEIFKAEMLKLPEEIGGVIYGPNHAMPLDELRRSIDKSYPVYQCPDICHNVRCETPVHFLRDDWHCAYASTLGREAINPRPRDYRALHRRTRQFVSGNITYSEGVNDDVNKIVWSDMDFNFDCSLRETLKDYSRVFIPGADCDMIADAILGLELNWESDPIENSSVENVYKALRLAADENPIFLKNWRFLMLLFRAQCDKIVRDRRIFELNLIETAKAEIRDGNIKRAKEILETDFSDEYKKLRAELFDFAEELFNMIGFQLDVEHLGGRNWERGCTLDTIDLPVTDREYLLKKISQNPSAEYMLDIINRNKVDTDEYYFSFSEHGFEVCGKQKGEYYFDFKGDSNFDAELPMCMLSNYDHFNFKMQIAGLSAGDYQLRISYRHRPDERIIHHKITLNSNVIYDGPQYGGTRDIDFEEKYLTRDYRSIVYDIDAGFINNGCAVLEITEPLAGFEFCEFWVTKK